LSYVQGYREAHMITPASPVSTGLSPLVHPVRTCSCSRQ
jgi:hypothetical protein